jgi:hypothetical protein
VTPADLDRLTILASATAGEFLPGWEVRGTGHDRASVRDENDNVLLETYGNKDRFLLAEYIAALEPAVVLELLRVYRGAVSP